jgi:hypothetical protein
MARITDREFLKTLTEKNPTRKRLKWLKRNFYNNPNVKVEIKSRDK